MTTQFNVPANLFKNADVQASKMPLFVYSQMVREASLAWQICEWYGTFPNDAYRNHYLYAIQKSVAYRDGRNLVLVVPNDNSIITAISEMAAYYANNERAIVRHFKQDGVEDVFAIGL